MRASPDSTRETRPLMMGEEGRRVLQRRGTACAPTGNLDGAEEDLKRALGAGGVRDWVLARIRIEFGKLADVRGSRAKAEEEIVPPLPSRRAWVIPRPSARRRGRSRSRSRGRRHRRRCCR